MLEMRYLFEAPFVVYSGAIAAELGVKAPPLGTAVLETLDSYRSAVAVKA